MNEEKKVTPMRAIRAKCLDCMAGQIGEVRLCPSRGCPLWAFRMGRNPNLQLSEEERERRSRQARENVAFIRQAREEASDVP